MKNDQNARLACKFFPPPKQAGTTSWRGKLSTLNMMKRLGYIIPVRRRHAFKVHSV
jgi:hypothetical protein